MAKYRGREYTIESYPVEEYSVVLVDKDGNKETVKLSQVTLTKQEATEFLKRETYKMETKRALDEKVLADEAKRTAEEAKKQPAEAKKTTVL